MAKGRTNQQVANAAARKAGSGRATKVEYGDVMLPTVTHQATYGVARCNKDGVCTYWYPKGTHAWPNEFYQHAECTVVLPLAMADFQKVQS